MKKGFRFVRYDSNLLNYLVDFKDYTNNVNETKHKNLLK